MTAFNSLPLASQITSRSTSGDLIPMYYDERIIDGVLHFRTIPNGPWQLKFGPLANAVNAMSKLTDEERMDVMRFFCRECGVKLDGRACTCCRDE